MWNWFMQGGFLMWPVAAAGLIALGLAIDAGRRVVGGDGSGARGPRVRGRIGAVLFWGGFAALVGLLGTLGGIGQMAGALQSAGDAPASLVWGGIRVALIPSALGLSILTLSLALWFGLSAAYRRKSRA